MGLADMSNVWAAFSHLFRPRKQETTPAPGVFSTDLDPLPERRVHLISELIPRTIRNFRAVSPAGVAMDAGEYSTPDVKGVSSSADAGVPESLWKWFSAQGFIGYQMCAVLAQHWLVDKACSVPARDATRVKYTVSAEGEDELKPEMQKYISRLDRKFGLRAQGREFIRNCKIFGIRIALFEVYSPDPLYYEKPFNPDGVGPGCYKGISQVDPYWVTPELDPVTAGNPADRHFYEPTYWRIAGKRYHRSHLVIIRTCDPPDILKPTYYFGGVPLPQQIFERVYAAERTANEAPQLAASKRSTVLSGVDLNKVAGNAGKFVEQMTSWAYWRDNYGVKVCGPGESVQQFDTTLADFDAVIMTQYTLVAAIARVPITKLLGTSPKGFNATGEYDESEYHEELESLLEHDVRPLYERHHLLLMRSYVMPKFGLSKPIPLALEFDELDAETAEERANREKADSERDVNLVNTGGIDGMDVRHRLQNEEGGSYANIGDAEPALPLSDGQNENEDQGTSIPASTPISAPAPAAPAPAPTG